MSIWDRGAAMEEVIFKKNYMYLDDVSTVKHAYNEVPAMGNFTS